MFDRKLVVAYALVTLSPYPFLDGEKDGKLDWDIWGERDIKAREGGTERERELMSGTVIPFRQGITPTSAREEPGEPARDATELETFEKHRCLEHRTQPESSLFVRELKLLFRCKRRVNF